MSVLARYRKRGGFKQLLQLIESSSPEKQVKLLQVIEGEDKDMAELVRKKCLSFEKFCQWKAETIYLCIHEMTLQYQAILCKTMPEDVWQSVRPLFEIKQLREIEDTMESGKDPLAGEVIAAHGALFTKIRYLDEEKVISLSQIDPSLSVPEAA